MADILHDFPIRANAERVFAGFATPAGLDQWWTLRSSGSPVLGGEYSLWFGPDYDWRARVTRISANEEFELELVTAMKDWVGTRVGVRLTPSGDMTQVSFWHKGWAEPGEHFRTSSCCWAMYLRILRRHIEHGESVPYAQRLDV